MNVTIYAPQVDPGAALRAAIEAAVRDALAALGAPADTPAAVALYRAGTAHRFRAEASVAWGGTTVCAEGHGPGVLPAVAALHGTLRREAELARRVHSERAASSAPRLLRRPGSAPASDPNRVVARCPPGYR